MDIELVARRFLVELRGVAVAGAVVASSRLSEQRRLRLGERPAVADGGRDAAGGGSVGDRREGGARAVLWRGALVARRRSHDARDRRGPPRRSAGAARPSPPSRGDRGCRATASRAGSQARPSRGCPTSSGSSRRRRCASSTSSPASSTPSGFAPLAAPWRRLEARRRGAADRPWTQAILRVLEIEAYRDLPGHDPGWVAAYLGIDEPVAASALAFLEETGQIRRAGTHYKPEGLVVDTRLTPEVGRRLKRHWTEVAGEKIGEGAQGQYSYNVFAISKVDLERIREMHLAYFRALARRPSRRPIRAEVVAVVNVQLVPLGTNDPGSLGGEVPGGEVPGGEVPGRRGHGRVGSQSVRSTSSYGDPRRVSSMTIDFGIAVLDGVVGRHGAPDGVQAVPVDLLEDVAVLDPHLVGQRAPAGSRSCGTRRTPRRPRGGAGPARSCARSAP